MKATGKVWGGKETFVNSSKKMQITSTEYRPSDYLQQIFKRCINPRINTKPAEVIVDNSEDRIIYFGNTRADLRGEPVFRNFRKSKRMLVIGKTGDGKSVFANSIACQFMNYNIPTEFICDIKGHIYSTISKPVQDYYYQFLPPGVKPRGYEVKSYIPKTIIDFSKKPQIREGEQVFQYNMKEIDFRDLVTVSTVLSEAANKGKSTVDILEVIWNECGGDIDSFQAAIKSGGNFEIGGEFVSVSNSIRVEIINAINLVKIQGMVGATNNVDINADFDKGKCVAINLKGKDNVRDSRWHSICAVEIRRAFNYYKPILVIVDEAHNLIMRNFWNSAQFYLFKSLQEGRDRGENLLLLGQTVKSSRTKNAEGRQVTTAVDPRVAKNCDYVFLTGKTSEEDRKTIAENIANPLTNQELNGTVEIVGNQVVVLQRGLQQLGISSEGRAEWCLIDVDKPVGERLTFFWPYISPCFVNEEKS